MFGELWRGSAPGTVANDPNWKRSPIGPIVHVWWVLYGLGGIAVTALMITNITIGGGVRDAAEFYHDSSVWAGLSTAVTVASGIAYLLLVRALTRRQQALTGQH